MDATKFKAIENLIGEKTNTVGIIKKTARGLVMASIRVRKNWTTQQAEDKVMDWLMSGTKLPMLEYLEAM
jgi:hypothetical protein